MTDLPTDAIERAIATADYMLHTASSSPAQTQLAALVKEKKRLAKLAFSLGHYLSGIGCTCNMSKCKCGYDDLMERFDVWQGVSHQKQGDTQ